MNLVMHPLKTTFVQKTWLGRDKVEKVWIWLEIVTLLL